MRHGVPEMIFSAIAHSDKQISLQISATSVEMLLIELGDSALGVLFGSYRKTEQNTASRSMLFSNAAGALVCFHT